MGIDINTTKGYWWTGIVIFMVAVSLISFGASVQKIIFYHEAEEAEEYDRMIEDEVNRRLGERNETTTRVCN